jgi:Concanavalin A-like lectin/glucanases superfamily
VRRLVIVLIAAAVLATGGAVTYAAFLASTSNTGNSVSATSSFTACDYDATVLATSGLVNYWRLGEASGATTAVDGKGTSNGTYVGAPALGQTGAIAGDTNKAARFDGSNDSMDVADTAALRLNGSWSLEFWGKAISFPGSGWPGVLEKNSATTANGYELWFDRISGDFSYKRNNVSNGMPNMEIETGGYKHFVLTYNGTTLKGYENGTEVYSATASWPTNAGTSAFQLGKGDSTFGNVDLDDFAVYNTAISAATAQDHFRCGQRYRDVVLDTSGLQSYWRLGEPLGGVAFDSKGPSDGDYTGPPELGQTGALTAPGDLAASFDSLNDWADVGDVYDFSGTSAFSVEAWINRGTLRETGFRWIVGKDTTNAPREGWNMNLGANTHTVRFERWSNNASNTATSTTAVAAGTWYHLVGTYNGATMKLYVNGQEQASVASTHSQANTAFPFRIGAIGGTGGGKFSGLIDEVAVYNTALTAAQVDQHYEAR